jgi:hypothetical protein
VPADQLTALATFLELEQDDDSALMHIGGALVFGPLDAWTAAVRCGRSRCSTAWPAAAGRSCGKPTTAWQDRHRPR